MDGVEDYHKFIHVFEMLVSPVGVYFFKVLGVLGVGLV